MDAETRSLITTLAEYLDDDGFERRIDRAYTATLSPVPKADAYRELAARLRESAEIAEQIARHVAGAS